MAFCQLVGPCNHTGHLVRISSLGSTRGEGPTGVARRAYNLREPENLATAV
jgi:hypothetical protein